VPSSTACNVALDVPSAAGAGSRQMRAGHQASPVHGRSATRLRAQRLLRHRDTSEARATIATVVRFYTTVPPIRERAISVGHASTSTTKEQRSQMVARRADIEPVRRCLPGRLPGRGWSWMRAAVPRGGSIRPPRGTAPPIATHRGVAGDHQGAVFCQEGVLVSPRPLSSDGCGRPAWPGRSCRCQD